MKKAFLITLLTMGATLITLAPLRETPTPPKPDFSTSASLNSHLFTQKQVRKSRPKYDRPDQAMLEEIALRSELNRPFSYQGNWRFRAWEAAQSMRLSSRTALPWEEHGPGNVGGRSRALIIDPTDSTHWYAGAVGGGVWETHDMGLSWIPLTDMMPVLSVTTLAQCWTQPNVIYAGTGEGFYNSDAVIGDGILKSTNGGGRWTQLAATVDNPSFRYVNRLIVDPTNPLVVLAATNSGVYRSVDGGLSWEEVFNNNHRIQQIVANPHNFAEMYLTANNSGIFKSTDGGQSWNRTDTFTGTFYRIEMAIAPSNPAILYATTVNSASGVGGFYRSEDSGVTWTNLSPSVNWLGGQGWYDNTLVVNPFNPDEVLVGGINLYRCTVNGNSVTVSQISQWYEQPDYPYVHADQHFLVTIPHNDGSSFGVVATNDGGVFYSPDGGNSWSSRVIGYNVTQFYDGDMHPGRVQIIAGAQDNGTNLSPPTPDSASYWTEPVGGDGFDCAWNKFDPNVLYATLYSTRIYKSTDGGASFFSIDNGLQESNLFHTPLAMSPFDPDLLFTAGDGNSFYRTENGGDSWDQVYVNYDGYPRKKIAPSLSNPDIVWTASLSNNINVSTDGGWTFTTVTRPSGSPTATPTGLYTDPLQDSTAFITFGVSGYGKIFRTRDLGDTWTDLTNNLPDIPVHCLLVLPHHPDEYWIGTDVGLFVSTDAGQTWGYSDSGLPAVSIRRLKIIGQRVLAVTHGRGTFSVFMDELPPIELPVLAPLLPPLEYPSPGSTTLRVPFEVRSAHDSVQIVQDDSLSYWLGPIPAFTDTAFWLTNLDLGPTSVQVIGYTNGLPYPSDIRTLELYAPAQTVIETFDSSVTTFTGDFIISHDPGFFTNTMHTLHPYGSGQEYIARLGVPVIVTGGQELSYRDIAIVEPGEAGSAYPDYNMWDYVTVEATTDGDQWTMLIDPYDARANGAWLQAYNSGGGGNETMLVTHTIPLEDFYSPGTIIYIRFRLFADTYVTGWGWAIDDVNVGSGLMATGRKPDLPESISVFPAYPNPFNSTTVFSLRSRWTTTADITIYDLLGRQVRRLEHHRVLPAGATTFIRWDGKDDLGRELASGTYLVETMVGRERKTQKVLFMK
ncbi:MAG: T9SS C-terminal target domain-containing protein [Candidatus Neomarinimicrobiota bacterium]|nr:MAG: T9SS C-terminal target domain-containing protein [Candidatus Neomarinimicrobiota bacterium]